MSTARSSVSVFGSIEPKNTKYVFTRVQQFVLEELSRRNSTVRFAQVGANDGQRADPLHPFIKAGGWEGLLIEPLPGAFDVLKETYAGIPGLQFANIAIGATDGTTTFYAVEGVMDVLSSLSREAIMKHADTRPGLEDMIREITVPSRRLDHLLAEYQLTQLDLLAVDTEGCDDMVLSTFDLERVMPPVVLFEHVLLSSEGSQQLKERFEAAHYTLIWDRHDVVALRQDFFPSALQQFLREVVDVAKQK